MVIFCLRSRKRGVNLKRMELDSQVNQSMKYCLHFEEHSKECNLRGNILLTLYAGFEITCEETLTKMSTWEGMKGTM